MLRCTVLYPNKNGAKFDFDYYIKKHIPFANEAFGLGGGGFKVSKGLPGPDGSAPVYLCIATAEIASPEAFAARMQASGAKVAADVPNYTDITPVVQMAEVLL